MSPRTASGFTLIELLVVIAFMAVIIAILMTGFRDYARFQQYNQAVSEVQFVLNQARTLARSADADASHGVKFTGNSITQFTGDAYVASDPENVTTTYPLVTLTPDLTGSVDEIVFTKLTGLPTATGTILIEGSQYDASTTVTITGVGVVQ